MRELCGREVPSTQVSRLTAEFDDEFEKWGSRPLPKIRYLVLDATYTKARHGGAVRDCTVLTAIGIRRADGKHLEQTSMGFLPPLVDPQGIPPSFRSRGRSASAARF